MSGALCDALTGQHGGRAVLEALDRDNLFLVPLDDRRQWYRYHHLFADVLQARLLDEQPERVAELHRRASGWYEENGDRAEADPARAGRRRLRARRRPDRAGDAGPAAANGARRRSAAGSRRLPDDVLRVRPVLGNALAGARMSTGTFEGVEELLNDAEQWLDREADATGGVVVDQDEFRRLPGRARRPSRRPGPAARRCRGHGHLRPARARAGATRRRPARHAARPRPSRGWRRGRPATLSWHTTSYAASLVDFERIDHISDVLGCAFTLADIQVARGSLRGAMRTYDEALALASRQGPRTLRGQVGMHVGRASLQRELNDLAAARSELTRSRELGEHAGLPASAYRWRVAMAQVCEAEGDVDAAIKHLDEAEQVYDGDFSPNVRPVPALRARTWIRQGRLDEAASWAAQRGLSVTDEVSYLREFEHVTLARLLVAERDEQALDLLGRLLRAAEVGKRSGSMIEIRVVEALAHQSRGDMTSALASLDAAIGLAEPEGYVRTFLDEGAPMTALLAAAAFRGGASAYLRRLVAASGVPSERPATAPTHPMVEALSSRERDVLRLLATELNGPEIARELVVSLNTVRTHTKNLYMKLGVNSRQAALRRARELDLL